MNLYILYFSFFSLSDGKAVTVSWVKDGKQIGAGDRFILSVEGCIHCLEICDVTIADAGNYSCERHERDCGAELCMYILKIHGK